MKRTFPISPNTHENPFMHVTFGHKKTNYSRAKPDALVMPQKGRPDSKQETFSIHKDSRISIQGNLNPGDTYDFHGLRIQKPKSYSFIVDWQL